MALRGVAISGMRSPNWRGSPRPVATSQTSQITNYFNALSEQARQENIKREKEVRGIYSGLVSQYSKGSPFYKAGMADITSQEKQLVGQETQNLISGGLYGTTTAASVPTRVANEFGRPARLKLEDMLQTKQTEAKMNYANFIERIQNPYPDYNALIQAFAG